MAAWAVQGQRTCSVTRRLAVTWCARVRASWAPLFYPTWATTTRSPTSGVCLCLVCICMCGALGSFVLSYLGHNYKITHFRCVPVSGVYMYVWCAGLLCFILPGPQLQDHPLQVCACVWCVYVCVVCVHHLHVYGVCSACIVQTFLSLTLQICSGTLLCPTPLKSKSVFKMNQSFCNHLYLLDLFI